MRATASVKAVRATASLGVRWCVAARWMVVSCVVLADCWAPSSSREGRPSFVLMKFPLVWIHPSVRAVWQPPFAVRIVSIVVHSCSLARWRCHSKGGKQAADQRSLGRAAAWKRSSIDSRDTYSQPLATAGLHASQLCPCWIELADPGGRTHLSAVALRDVLLGLGHLHVVLAHARSPAAEHLGLDADTLTSLSVADVAVIAGFRFGRHVSKMACRSAGSMSTRPRASRVAGSPPLVTQRRTVSGWTLRYHSRSM